MKTQYTQLLKPLKQRLTAAVLLAAVLFTLTPAGLFHHHHEEEVCEQNDPHHESDPCHATLYHADEAGLAHCTHTVHIEADGEECYLCQYLSNHHGYEYIIHRGEDALPSVLSSDVEGFRHSFLFSNSVHTPFNKGPPVIKM